MAESHAILRRQRKIRGEDRNDQAVESTLMREPSEKGAEEQIGESVENPKSQAPCTPTGGEEGMAVAVSPLYPNATTTPVELNEQKWPLEMRWRSPGRCDAPKSEDGQVGNSPQSIAQSVPGVETAMFRETQLDYLSRRAAELAPRNLPVNPVIPIKIEGEMSPPRKFPGKPAKCDPERCQDAGETKW